MNPDTASTLVLPRPLVNKILAHAQQHEHQRACGVISRDRHDRLHFHPLTSTPTIAADAPCFAQNSSGFNAMQATLNRKQQNLLACVFSLTDRQLALSADNGLFPQDQCYYIITSMNTKGVIEMQGHYRDGAQLKKIDLTLEQG
ncbi:MAG TPA: hypothetical protein ENJ64_05960 [Thiotrichales bacterium]|nr:hypothetical protein [Thiotrichales bacterium]